MSKTLPIDEVLYELLHCETRTKQLVQMQEILGHADSSKRLGDFIIDFVGRDVKNAER